MKKCAEWVFDARQAGDAGSSLAAAATGAVRARSSSLSESIQFLAYGVPLAENNLHIYIHITLAILALSLFSSGTQCVNSHVGDGP